MTRPAPRCRGAARTSPGLRKGLHRSPPEIGAGDGCRGGQRAAPGPVWQEGRVVGSWPQPDTQVESNRLVDHAGHHPDRVCACVVVHVLRGTSTRSGVGHTDDRDLRWWPADLRRHFRRCHIRALARSRGHEVALTHRLGCDDVPFQRPPAHSTGPQPDGGDPRCRGAVDRAERLRCRGGGHRRTSWERLDRIATAGAPRRRRRALIEPVLVGSQAEGGRTVPTPTAKW